MAWNDVGNASPRVHIGYLETGSREEFVTIVPVESSELVQRRHDPVDRIIGQLRVGHVPLHTVHGQRCVNRTAPTIFDNITEFDTILGLFRDGFPRGVEDVPADILAMLEERQNARKDKDFQKADQLRDAIIAAGYTIEDTPEGPRVRKA